MIRIAEFKRERIASHCRTQAHTEKTQGDFGLKKLPQLTKENMFGNELIRRQRALYMSPKDANQG